MTTKHGLIRKLVLQTLENGIAEAQNEKCPQRIRYRHLLFRDTY